MIKKYLKISFITVLTLTIISSCASKNNNQTANTADSNVAYNDSKPTQEQPVDDGIDWDTPLYSIDTNGDTSTTYTYNAAGKRVKYSNYYEGALSSGEDYLTMATAKPIPTVIKHTMQKNK